MNPKINITTIQINLKSQQHIYMAYIMCAYMLKGHMTYY